MSKEEWANSPLNARNNPKISPERAQQLYDEAIAHNHKWDVQEQINARRLSDLQSECGDGLGKISAPAKLDAAILTPRCQAGAGAFGTYFVHISEKFGLKVFRSEDQAADPGWEFDRMGRAHAAGVNVPEPLALNYTRTGTHVMTMSHMKGYVQLAKTYDKRSTAASGVPLIVRTKIAREYRKLHTEGLAHGDIHGGNILVNPRSKRVGLVDFGYSTQLDDSRHRIHNKDGITNLLSDLRALPRFLGASRDFIERNEGVLANIEKQAKDYGRSWDKFELAVKRYHDALESELLKDDRLTRSRFISGADQPRIPGLTRRIVTANANTRQREILEQAARRQPTFFNEAAQNLGFKPSRLRRALEPERVARARQKPFGTPIPVLSHSGLRQRRKFTPFSVGMLFSSWKD
jgi:serine/threonine-protein kinase RIO1